MSHRPTCPDCGVILPCTRYEHRKGCSWIPAIPDPRDEQISALQQEIARLTAELAHSQGETHEMRGRSIENHGLYGEAKRHLDAIAEALHPHKPKDGGWTYLPDQLAEMVTALKRENEALASKLLVSEKFAESQRLLKDQNIRRWTDAQERLAGMFTDLTKALVEGTGNQWSSGD